MNKPNEVDPAEDFFNSGKNILPESVKDMAKAIYIRLPKDPITDQTMPGVLSRMDLALEHAKLFHKFIEQQERD